jgi:hypothetical protein
MTTIEIHPTESGEFVGEVFINQLGQARVTYDLTPYKITKNDLLAKFEKVLDDTCNYAGGSNFKD